MNTLPPSDERLNALIDGELTPADAEPLLEQLRTDPELRTRLGELRLGKELLRHAYRVPPAAAGGGRAAARPPRRRSLPTRPLAAFAGLLLVLAGTGLGWALRGHDGGPTELAVADAAPLAPAAAQHIVLHLGSGDPRLARAVLDRAEGLLDAARAAGRDVHVDLVANGGGLDLLRQDVSTQVDRIEALRRSYPQLALIACGQTAQRLRDHGVTVRLLPGTVEASSALDAIVLRLQQGWSYLRV